MHALRSLVFFGLVVLAFSLISADGGAPPPNLSDPLTLYHDFGAVGDCSADDAPSIQALLDAFVATGRGGDIRIPDKTPLGAAARYCLRTPIYENFAGRSDAGASSEGTWRVHTTGATLLPRVGSGPPGTDITAITFEGAQLLVLEGWQAFGQFPGVPGGDAPVADIVLLVRGCNVVLRDSIFNGFVIADDTSRDFAFQSNRGVVTFIDSNVEIDNLQGAASGGSRSAFLTLRGWSDVSIHQVRYTDFYLLGGSLYAPAAPSVFLQLGDVNNAVGALQQRAVSISDITIDEGVALPILINPTNASARFIDLERLNINLNAGTGSVPIELENVLNARLSAVYVHRGGQDSKLLSAHHCGTITMTDWTLDSNIALAPAVDVDATVAELRVRNTGFFTSGAASTVCLN